MSVIKLKNSHESAKKFKENDIFEDSTDTKTLKRGPFIFLKFEHRCS